MQDWKLLVCAFLILIGASSCEEIEEQAHLKLFLSSNTMVDDRVEGVYLTFADITLNGQTILGDLDTTIVVDTLYENDSLYDLGGFILSPGKYNELQLTLDFEENATTGLPGCYILTRFGRVLPLESSSNTIDVDFAFDLDLNDIQSHILRLDLNKLIYRDKDNNYHFAPQQQRTESITLIDKGNAVEDSYSVRYFGNRESIFRLFAYPLGSLPDDLDTSYNATTNSRFNNALFSLGRPKGSFGPIYLDDQKFDGCLVRYVAIDNSGNFKPVMAYHLDFSEASIEGLPFFLERSEFGSSEVVDSIRLN